MTYLRFILVSLFMVVSLAIYVSQHVLEGALEKERPLLPLQFENDFFHYYNSAQAAAKGRQVYCTQFDTSPEALAHTSRINTATNPPPLVALTLPLGFLDQTTAWWFWQFVLVVSVIGAIILLARMCGVSWKVSIALSCLMIFSNPTLQSLRFSQVQPLLLLLLVVCAYYAQSKRRDVYSGLFLGLAVGLKYFTLPIIFFFLGARRFRVAFIALGIASLLNAPFLFSEHISFWDFQACGGKEISRWVELTTFNQSLYGLIKNVWSMFIANDARLVEVLNKEFAQYIRYGLLVASGFSFIIGRKLILSHFTFGFALSISVTILFGPIAWTHYYILLVIPIFVFLSALDSHRIRFRYALCLWCLSPMMPVVFSLSDSLVNYTGELLLMRFLGWSSAIVPAILFWCTFLKMLCDWRRERIEDVQ